MKRCMPVLFFVLLLSQGCLKGQVIQKNAQIDPKVKATVTELNKQAYKAMSENNFGALSAMFTDTLKMSTGEDFEKQFLPNMARIMKGRTYKVFDEFYVRGTKPGDSSVFGSGKGDNAYTTKIFVKSAETYMTMMIAGDSVNEIMLTLTWCNLKGKWQIYGITGEDYSLKKKTAIDLYNYALALDKKGYMMDATSIMGMSSHCAYPGGRVFSYTKFKEMAKYADTLTAHTKAKYPFPYTLDDVPTKPAVVNIHYQLDSADFIPMIVYQSVINVADTSATKKENLDIQQRIGKIFPGMDKVNKKLFYRVYNALPNGQNDPPYFGYVQKL